MTVTIIEGDCRQVLETQAAGSVNQVLTSPPYFGLRNYEMSGQIGLEPTPAEFVSEMVAIGRQLHRVLRKDGTFWLNLGDSFSHGGSGSRDAARWPKQSRNDHMPVHAKKKTGLPPKSLLGIPWRVALALQDDGWILRQDIVWSKPNAMPESVTDRCTRSHEFLFMFSKSARYYYDADAIKEPVAAASLERIRQRHFDEQTGGEKDYGTTGVNKNRSARKIIENFRKQDAVGKRQYDGFNERWESGEQEVERNKRDVWTVPTISSKEQHFAMFPPKLIYPAILAGCPAGGTVLDPFMGAGTTGMVAQGLERNCIGIELNPKYAADARERISRKHGVFSDLDY